MPKTHTSTIDLNQPPKIYSASDDKAAAAAAAAAVEEAAAARGTDQPKKSVALPDFHGNTYLIIHRLIANGVLAPIAQERLAHLKTLYELHIQLMDQNSLDKEAIQKNVDEFEQAIQSIVVNKNVFTIFIGDLLADRGAQDYFTLCLLDHLQQHGAEYEILFSNHDAGFLAGCASNFQIEDHKSGFGCAPTKLITYLSGSDQSYNNLVKLIENGVLTKEKVRDLTDSVYKPHLKLLSYETEQDGQIILFTHAPVDFQVIADAAKHFGVQYKDETADDFYRTVDLINLAFLKKVLDNTLIQEYNKEMAAPDKPSRHRGRNAFTDSTRPLSNFTWTRIQNVSTEMVAADQEDGIRETLYCPMDGWKKAVINVHGHVGAGLGTVLDSTRYINLDSSSIGKSSYYQSGEYKEYIGTQCTPQLLKNLSKNTQIMVEFKTRLQQAEGRLDREKYRTNLFPPIENKRAEVLKTLFNAAPTLYFENQLNYFRALLTDLMLVKESEKVIACCTDILTDTLKLFGLVGEGAKQKIYELMPDLENITATAAAAASSKVEDNAHHDTDAATAAAVQVTPGYVNK